MEFFRLNVLFIVAFSATFISCANGLRCDGGQDEPERPKAAKNADLQMVVPRDLTDWTITMTFNNDRPHPLPRVDIQSDGSMTIGRDITTKLNEDELSRIFESAAALINATHLAIPRREYNISDAAKYEIRLAQASRVIRVELEDPQPTQMGIEPELARIIAILNGSLHQETWRFSKPWKLDETYRDNIVGGHREVAPESLDWSWVDIRTTVGTQGIHLRMHRKDGAYMGGLLVETSSGKSVRERADPQLRKEFYRVARETINEFQFGRADSRPMRTGTPVEIGTGANGRWITIEYSKDAVVPVDVLERISKIVKMSGL